VRKDLFWLSFPPKLKAVRRDLIKFVRLSADSAEVRIKLFGSVRLMLFRCCQFVPSNLKLLIRKSRFS